MSLPPETCLGVYELAASIGAGGMGEVYRATDTKLDRAVAIKVLPAEVAGDAERLARFEREAKLLASLNHPNIAHVYGFESAALPDGSSAHFLAMELVEGEDLAARLKRGAIPVDEALEIAKQIAEALEDAHEHGIVHRDLKPANVKVTPDGKVKVLDFGLAKAYAGETTSGSGHDLSQSPTLAHTGTQAGVILGTAAYMSPEQARGKAVDKRADIWAFGVVLFEMLTGRQLFTGETVSDVLAAVLTREPDASTLPPATPANVRGLLRRCIERNARNRLHDIADARIVIDELLSGRAGDEATAGAGGSQPRRAPGWSRALPWALLLLTVAGWLVTRLTARQDPAGPALSVLPLDLGDEPLVMNLGASAVLSPDGRRLAWVGGRQSESWIMVRDLDSAESRRLDGTEGGHDPVFSPDGQEIAFFGSTALLKVPVRGGVPQRLAEVSLPRGATWTDDDFVIYNRDVADGLWRVAGRGGTPERLTTPDEKQGERSHRWPRLVPGTRRVLFLSQKLGERYEEATIEMLDLDSGGRTLVHRGGSYPRVTSRGELLYVRDNALWAAPLDAKAGRLTRAPVRVLDEVAYSDWSGGAQFDVADEGSLVYSTGRSDEAVELSWYDPRSGRFERIEGEPGYYYTPALAPDGHSLALQVYTGGRSDIWVFDLADGSRRRLTFGGRDEHPVWSPDGSWIAFSRIEEGSGRRVTLARADGAGEPVAFAADRERRFPTSWSPAGALLMTERSPQTHADILVGWPGQPDRAPEPFLRTPANEGQAVFSPDGRWVLYQSDESGADEVYVRSYPGPGGRWQVSEDGGVQPRWSPDGRSVYYWSRAGLCRREVRLEGMVFVPGRLSVTTVEKPVLRSDESGYIVASDGRLLLFPFAGQGRERPRTHLILGWDRDLQRRLAGSR